MIDLAEKMVGKQIGIVEAYTEVYEPLKQFGVPARVWDAALDEMFDMKSLQFPWEFQELVFDLEVGKKAAKDFLRAEGMSDQDYVCSILKLAVADSRSKGEMHKEDMEMRPANPLVGNVRNNGPEMLNSA